MTGPRNKTTARTELEHREQQLDQTLAALLSIYKSPRGAKETARKALVEILGFTESTHA